MVGLCQFMRVIGAGDECECEVKGGDESTNAFAQPFAQPNLISVKIPRSRHDQVRVWKKLMNASFPASALFRLER